MILIKESGREFNSALGCLDLTAAPRQSSGRLCLGVTFALRRLTDRGASLKVCVCTQTAELADRCIRAAAAVACSTTLRDEMSGNDYCWREFDLIVVDMAMPGASFLLPDIRRATAAFVICLSPIAKLSSFIRVVNRGADNVLADNIGVEQLQAHFQAIARHKGGRVQSTALVHGDFVLDRATGVATWRSRPIDFRSQRIIYRLFVLLFENAGECVSLAVIWRRVWTASRLAPNAETIQRAVWRLRRLLSDVTGGDHVATVRREGYRFVADGGADLDLGEPRAATPSARISQ